MRQDAAEAVLIQLAFQPVRRIRAGTGDLHRAVADVCHLLQRKREVLQILTLLPEILTSLFAIASSSGISLGM